MKNEEYKEHLLNAKTKLENALFGYNRKQEYLKNEFDKKENEKVKNVIALKKLSTKFSKDDKSLLSYQKKEFEYKDDFFLIINIKHQFPILHRKEDFEKLFNKYGNFSMYHYKVDRYKITINGINNTKSYQDVIDILDKKIENIQKRIDKGSIFISHKKINKEIEFIKQKKKIENKDKNKEIYQNKKKIIEPKIKSEIEEKLPFISNSYMTLGHMETKLNNIQYLIEHAKGVEVIKLNKKKEVLKKEYSAITKKINSMEVSTKMQYPKYFKK